MPQIPQLDDTFLASLGLGAMPAEEKEAFLSFIRTELESRIGAELSEGLSDEQLAEFEATTESDDPAATAKWLEGHCSNYKQVADRHLEQLRQEIIKGRDSLLASK